MVRFSCAKCPEPGQSCLTRQKRYLPGQIPGTVQSVSQPVSHPGQKPRVCSFFGLSTVCSIELTLWPLLLLHYYNVFLRLRSTWAVLKLLASVCLTVCCWLAGHLLRNRIIISGRELFGPMNSSSAGCVTFILKGRTRLVTGRD